MYPLDKYKFYIINGKDGNPVKVIAISSYAGRSVKGIAKCAPGDTFDLETGKKIAATRCAIKIAEKRLKRAQRKYSGALAAWASAEVHLDKMADYENNAYDALNRTRGQLNHLLENS